MSITLVPKSDQITYKKGNYRPTSFMNINTKMLSKVLADISAAEKKQ